MTGYQVGSARTDIDIPVDIRKRQITTKADLDGLKLPDLSRIADKLGEWGERWERDVVSQAN